MEVKRLYEMVDEDQKDGALGEKAYWKDLWKCYIEEKSMDYAALSVNTQTCIRTEFERTPSCGKLWRAWCGYSCR